MAPTQAPNLSIGRRAVVHFGDFTVGVLHDQGKLFGLVTIIQENMAIKCRKEAVDASTAGWQEINNKAQRSADRT